MQRELFHLELLEHALCLDIDPTFLGRVINNLFLPTIKVLLQGAPSKLMLIRIDDQAVITVSDQGRGT